MAASQPAKRSDNEFTENCLLMELNPAVGWPVEF
jgi:hypothetical protein